jgi:hypothetical protein
VSFFVLRERVKPLAKTVAWQPPRLLPQKGARNPNDVWNTKNAIRRFEEKNNAIPECVREIFVMDALPKSSAS